MMSNTTVRPNARIITQPYISVYTHFQPEKDRPHCILTAVTSVYLIYSIVMYACTHILYALTDVYAQQF